VRIKTISAAIGPQKDTAKATLRTCWSLVKTPAMRASVDTAKATLDTCWSHVKIPATYASVA